MKTEKSLEKLLNKMGFKLEWGKKGYFSNVPFAVRGNLKIALGFNTRNINYRNDSYITVLNLDLRKKELIEVLVKTINMIKNHNEFNNESLGNITYYNGRAKRYYTYEYLEGGKN